MSPPQFTPNASLPPLTSAQPLAQAWRVLALTSLAVFAVSLDATVLFVAFPTIRDSFRGVSAAQLSWVLNAYTIVFGALLVPAGRIADRFGRRRIFLIGVGLFTLASALCGISSSASALVASRALQAVGAALLMPSSLALVLGAFPSSRRASAVGLWAAVGALAAAAGPSLGSAIVQSLGWRWAFYLNLPVGAFAILRGRTVLGEARASEQTALPDPLGIVLLVASVGLIALGIVQIGSWGPLGAKTLAALGSGALLLATFVARSRRAIAPAVDLTLFNDRNYRIANLATVVFGISFSAMFFMFVFFLTQVWGYSLLKAGLAITPGPLTVIPVAIIAGRIADARGHRLLLVVGGLVFALGGALMLASVRTRPDFLFVWLPRAMVTGVGVGLVLPSLSGAAVQGLPAARFAVGSAVTQAVRQLASVLGVAAVIALLDARSGSSLLIGFEWICALLVAGGLLTAALCLRLERKPGSALERGDQASSAKPFARLANQERDQ
jgi:EmrB/QacA subfamily drug resistance transporter